MGRLVDFSYRVNSRVAGEEPVCALNLTLTKQGESSQENPAQDHHCQERVVLTAVALNDTVAGLARIRQQLFSGTLKSQTN
jgi:hypothetical protein